MEERPSDSQNESANELPQSVPQQPLVAPATADESAVTQRSEDRTQISGRVTPDRVAPDRVAPDRVAPDQGETEQRVDTQTMHNRVETEEVTDIKAIDKPDKVEKDTFVPVIHDPIANESVTPDETVDEPVADRQGTNGRSQETASAAEPMPQRQPNQPGQDRSRQDRSATDGGRGGQPRQNPPGTNQPRQQNPPRTDKSGQERSESDRQGQNKQREPNQPRQQNNPRDLNQPQKSGQERIPNEKPGQPRQQNGQLNAQDRSARDGGQPQKQNQPGQERSGSERQPRQGNQPGQERSGNERPSSERTGQERRDTRPARDMELDGLDEVRISDARPADRGATGPREETVRESDDRLLIGITLGDYNGIGPEVILKALQYNRLQKICTPIIYGSMRVLNRYRNLLEMKDWNLNGIQLVEQASHKLTNVITCWPDQNQEIQPGKVTAEAGQAAFACLQRAVDDLREGKLDAIVTAPINKHNIQSEEFKFPGHTEYLAEAFAVPDNLMFMVSERLRVGVVTGHVPLGRVRQNINRERILQKITMMTQSLRLDFGIDKPRIAVLGLNPHAGEEGLLGNEEQEIVKPLIKQLQDKGNLVYGPFPADGFFGTRAYLKFDAVLAMYHDQGLIPFKAIAFEEGVNFTAALPVVRTSPDHGTAYDIAGKNVADETSMLQAIYTACDVARRRRETAEINAGALKPKRERAAEKSSGM